MKRSICKKIAVALCAVMVSGIITACQSPSQVGIRQDYPLSMGLTSYEEDTADLFSDGVHYYDNDDSELLDTAVAVSKASGKLVMGNSAVTIDYSNTQYGYFMLKLLEEGKYMFVVTTPKGSQYQYVVTKKGVWETFSFVDGNGDYLVALYKNVQGNAYTPVFNSDMSVKLKSANYPFLYPNQYVNYTAKTKVVTKATSLTAKCTNNLERVANIYKYVIQNYSYDYDKAKSVQSGYLPDLDTIYKVKMGICFDYAAVMTAMLRSQKIPAKLVIGWSPTGEYHAWVMVYCNVKGKIGKNVSFTGKSWKLMDPTYASTGKESDKVYKVINNTKGYTVRYIY